MDFSLVYSITEKQYLINPFDPIGGIRMPRIIIFRGDTRDPGIIKRDGFALHGEGAAAVQGAGGVLPYLQRTLKGKNGYDIQRWVIEGRNWGRPTISTAFDQGCGGYDGDYIYQIEFANLYEVPLRGSSIRNTLGMTETRGEPALFMLMDNMMLAASRTIAIGLNVGTKEVAFFTKIPPANITRYFHKSKGSWTLMSQVQAASAVNWKMNRARMAMFERK